MIKIERKELNHGYFLLQGVVQNIAGKEMDREYLLDLQNWFLEQRKILNEKRVCTITPCHAFNFHGIDCLADDERFGFYKSEHDIRPGHAIWIDKNKAERLLELFRRCD